jgi:hypothetical protein
MIGDEPTPKDSEPMTTEPMARSASFAPHAAPIAPGHAMPGQPIEGRRINFLAWGLAGVVGVAMWVVILKLI